MKCIGTSTSYPHATSHTTLNPSPAAPSNVGYLPQRVSRREGLGIRDVQRRPDMPAVQGIRQRSSVHLRAPACGFTTSVCYHLVRGAWPCATTAGAPDLPGAWRCATAVGAIQPASVDQQRAALHPGQEPRVDDVARLRRQGQQHDHDVRPRQQLVQVCADVGLGRAFCPIAALTLDQINTEDLPWSPASCPCRMQTGVPLMGRAQREFSDLWGWVLQGVLLPAMELTPGRAVRAMPRTRAPKGASRASRARPMLPCPRMRTSLSYGVGRFAACRPWHRTDERQLLTVSQAPCQQGAPPSRP